MKAFHLLIVAGLAMAPALGVADTSDENLALPEILTTDQDDYFLPDFSFAGYKNGLTRVPPATGVVVQVKGSKRVRWHELSAYTAIANSNWTIVLRHTSKN